VERADSGDHGGEPDETTRAAPAYRNYERQALVATPHDLARAISPPKEHHGWILPAPGEFSTRRIDDNPNLLTACYELRYQVYCVERAFLSANEYPNQLEVDEFDRYAWHLGTIDSAGQLVATARLVLPSILGLPLFRHCDIFREESELYTPSQSVVEVSRLSIGRSVRTARRTAAASNASGCNPAEAVAYSLYRGLYQESKRAGFTHWLVATEASLQRAVRHYAFPFRPIGPKIDYHGPVTPYLMDLSAFDRLVLSGNIPRLAGFLDGLDCRYHPGR
jgi:N-acyl amino acid synthase of PEP-CTERM/exosortase system